VLVETNGSYDISVLPQECVVIMDVKCPASGSADSLCQDNISHLRKSDECKMVISGREDFDWAVRFLGEYDLPTKCTVIFSPNTAKVSPRQLAEWILHARAPVMLGLQLHKYIWGEDARGV
jgi:7-carboxy-7-deazaguanine synthase